MYANTDQWNRTILIILFDYFSTTTQIMQKKKDMSLYIIILFVRACMALRSNKSV